ncbi:MAG: flagellar basal-body MS-ring/collar protein FliF [Cellulosilyticaceae bacterium]
MQQTIEQMSTQLTEKWGSLSQRQKVRLGVGVGALLAVIVLSVLIMGKPKMSVLYRNLELKEAASAAEVLDAQKIKYEVKDNGTTIEVNEKDLTKAKFALTTEGIPKGKYTFEDALNNTMSTTEDEMKAKMHRLKEVELCDALESMNQIKSADVKLVIPEEKNSFIKAEKESSASILLTLASSMNTKQVEGIARFVASSVEGLDEQRITIIDSEGNNLYSGQDEGVLATNKQQELKLAAETEIRNKVTDLLEPIYSEIRISPNLVLDFDRYEEMREEYISPLEGENKGLVDKEVIANSQSTNTPAGGEPGTATNAGDTTQYVLGSVANSESKTSNKETDYVNNKVVSNKVKNTGDVLYDASSLAVNVFKHKEYKQEAIEGTLPAGTTWEQFKESNGENKAIVVDPVLIESIKNGTGIQNVVVNGYEKPIFLDKEIYRIDAKDYLPFVLILLIILVIGLALIKFRKHEEVVETEPELEIEQILKAAKEEVELEEIELKESLETKRQIEKFVDEKPEAVANLLRNWLNDDDWE